VGPKRSVTRSRSAGGIAEPLASTIRTLETSRSRRSFGSDVILCSITGTKAPTVARWRAIHASDSSGSNPSGRTSEAPRSVHSVTLSIPNEWKRGAGQKMTSRRWSGTTESRSRKARASLRPAPRLAPFGRPVVPEVWITTRG
jgi:hypothetical protein